MSYAVLQCCDSGIRCFLAPGSGIRDGKIFPRVTFSFKVWLKPQLFLFLSRDGLYAVFFIFLFPWVRVRSKPVLRIHSLFPYYFLKVQLHHFSKIKNNKEVKKQVFLTLLFCLMIEGSGSGVRFESVPLTNESKSATLVETCSRSKRFQAWIPSILAILCTISILW